MAITLSDYNSKRPIKGLPKAIEPPTGTTVQGLKKLIALQTGLSDFNRIGLYNSSTSKPLKDRNLRIDDLAIDDRLLVKDLGPQVAWRTVFVVEYLGPILIHMAFVAARGHVWSNAGAMSTTQWLSFAMIVGHFVKREMETLFVHKFSANTMPARNIYKNSFFYWALSGVLCAWNIYGPRSLAATADLPVMDYLGLAIFLFGETGNALVHLHLSSLRAPGSTERKIPTGYGFALVTCPNYMYEVLSWVGVIVTSRSWAVAVFIAVGGAQMFQWALGKERAYRKEFGDKYKKKRYVMLPGLL
ncbi:hypothetical protein CDD82_2084 [Ophiocordyceps australis]|uniref:very-long-chain enoyl-CoA reductase n=1 Tax=Ophiocordyceps australis TaxID=1399860 RepID=A0A2C5ZTY6_9HYPO|nr:hypothetical protein CDD82_2084 [Ophiocordyceps australis]